MLASFMVSNVVIAKTLLKNSHVNYRYLVSNYPSLLKFYFLVVKLKLEFASGCDQNPSGVRIY